MTNIANPFVAYLAAPENFRTALEVARHFHEVKKHIKRSFLDDVEAALRRELMSSYKSDWKIERGESDLVGERCDVLCVIPCLCGGDPRACFRVHIEWNVYHGVGAVRKPFNNTEGVSARQESDPPLPQIRELQNRHHYKIPPTSVVHQFLAWRYTDDKLASDRPATLQIDSEDAALIHLIENRQQHIDRLVEHFGLLVPTLLKLNDIPPTAQ